jgi:hypothetical protein
VSEEVRIQKKHKLKSSSKTLTGKVQRNVREELMDIHKTDENFNELHVASEPQIATPKHKHTQISWRRYSQQKLLK